MLGDVHRKVKKVPLQCNEAMMELSIGYYGNAWEEHLFGRGMGRAVKVKWRISGKGRELKDSKGEATDSATEWLKEELKINLKFPIGYRRV